MRLDRPKYKVLSAVISRGCLRRNFSRDHISHAILHFRFWLELHLFLVCFLKNSFLRSQFVFKMSSTSLSGIAVDDSVKTLFDDMKLRNVYKWATFKIKDEKVILQDVVKKTADADEDDKACWEDLAGQLSDDEPRYVLYDFYLKTQTTKGKGKILAMFW